MTERARVYGGSMYDLAAEENLSDVVLEQMGQIKAIFRENPDYLKLLMNPAIDKAERIKLIDDAFGSEAEKYLTNFIKLLCEKNLLGEFEGCVEEFTRRYNNDHGIGAAVVTTAVALSEKQAAALKAKLESISGKKVSLEQKIDPSILAGIRVEIDGKLLDGTASGRLSGISKKLNETIM